MTETVIPQDSAIEAEPIAPQSGGVLAAMQPRLDLDRTAGPPASDQPPPAEYQFDPAMALQVAAALAIAGFVWFSRRRLKWLARKGFSILERIIRWLHMSPDEKI